MTTPTKPKHHPRRRWRLIFKIVLSLFLLFVTLTAARILIPALQYREAVMILLHYSDDCHAPCFMGITPGETTMDEALEILEGHEWVDDIQAGEYFNVKNIIWSEKAPEFLLGQDSYIVRGPEGFTLTGFHTTLYISFSSFVTVMGLPDIQFSSSNNNYRYHYTESNVALYHIHAIEDNRITLQFYAEEVDINTSYDSRFEAFSLMNLFRISIPFTYSGKHS